MDPGVIMIMHTDGKDNTNCNWNITNYIYQFQYQENVLAEPHGSTEHCDNAAALQTHQQ